MQIDYTRMQGTGNVIVIVDRRQRPATIPDAMTIRRLGDAGTGPGFDQLLWVGDAAGDAAASYRVFNADGSEVEQCGNGLRCLARYLAGDKAATMRLESPAGTLTAEVAADGIVAVDMGEPIFEPARIPFIADARADRYALQVGDDVIDVAVLSMGNPHCVLDVDDVDTADVAGLGPQIECHERFPARTNVGFMAVRARDAIDLRVFERGVGETRACGTGACAAVVAGQRRGVLAAGVRVRLPGGEVVVSSRQQRVWLSGDVEWMSEGSFDL